MESVHVEKRNGLTIKIMRDDSPFPPDEGGDDSLFLTAYHREFWVEGPNDYHKDETGKTVRSGKTIERDECIALAKKDTGDINYRPEFLKKYFVFGLEAYIHSGVRLALSMEGNFPDRAWDVSQLGLVFVSKKAWPTKEKARKAALSLIETWNDYLSGNVYGFRVENDAGENLESIWGFSGDYDAEGGALSEARSVVDHLTNKGLTDEKGQYLMPFMAAA